MLEISNKEEQQLLGYASNKPSYVDQSRLMDKITYCGETLEVALKENIHKTAKSNVCGKELKSSMDPAAKSDFVRVSTGVGLVEDKVNYLVQNAFASQKAEFGEIIGRLKNSA